MLTYFSFSAVTKSANTILQIRMFAIKTVPMPTRSLCPNRKACRILTSQSSVNYGTVLNRTINIIFRRLAQTLRFPLSQAKMSPLHQRRRTERDSMILNEVSLPALGVEERSDEACARHGRKSGGASPPRTPTVGNRT